MFHCPRCGTLVGAYADGSATVPALVGRCRAFEWTITGRYAAHANEWKSLGIAESINIPGNRMEN